MSGSVQPAGVGPLRKHTTAAGESCPPAAALINIHCHRRCARCESEIASFDVSAFDSAMLAGGYYSLGVHPWYIQPEQIRAALDAIAAAGNDPKLAAVGECGLDKNTAAAPEIQMAVFESQAALAECLQKPVMVHCVRAFNELLRGKIRLKPKQPWIVHGFNADPALAGQLVKHGCYLSFGKALLQPGAKAGRALAAVPVERLFLETDAADVPIGVIYATAVKITGLSAETLQRRILENFQNVIHHG